MASREFDVIVYGATGFTGLLTARYLHRKAAAPGREPFKWAIAGRNEAKLREVSRGVGGVPVVVADSDDDAALAAMAARAAAVATTVGPYTKYGSKLVAACVAAGTHYADLAGEFFWVREMIARHHASAAAKGVRIVPCCGFDCIPSDLGALFACRQLPVPAQSVKLLALRFNGLLSGGTAASARIIDKQLKGADKATRTDPYLLAPDAPASVKVDTELCQSAVRWDPDFGTVTVPFVMAPVNTRVVRRSLALSGDAVRYDEAMSVGAIARVAGFAATHIPSFVSGLSPKPGDGPSDSIQRDGGFDVELLARGARGERARVRVRGGGDPGYAATAVMLAESALCLALDAGRLPARGGVLTPATAMGEHLLRRMEATGRFTFDRTELHIPGKL